VPAIINLLGMIRKSMSMTVTGTSRATNASPSHTSLSAPKRSTTSAMSAPVINSTSG
jgi:hypothetical protein